MDKKDKVIETIDTKITEDWGVDWSPMEIVRDFLQNFYDDNSIDEIDIDIKEDTVTVKAPAAFDYQLLIYMKSTKKGEDTVGQYGEGFKAAALNAMRNHRCDLRFFVKDKALRFFFSSRILGGEQTRIVMCEVVQLSEPVQGSILQVSKCPKSLIDEFEFGLRYFYFEDNPLFGDELASAWEKDIFVFKSNTNRGYVFYGKILRATLDVPIVIVCNRKYKRIDDKIEHDRDRKAFNEDVLTGFLKYVFRPISNETKNIVLFLEDYWISGHKILSAIADSNNGHVRIDYPENYYAKSSLGQLSVDLRQLVDKRLKEYKERGCFECRSYMNKLGMKSAVSEIKKEQSEQKDRYNKMYTRIPTPLESKAIEHISNYIDNLVPGLRQNFSNITYTIGDSDEIIGEMKEKKAYYSTDVYLSKHFFSFSFSDAVALLAHEWNHIYGYDGSRSFSDALTHFIACLIDKRNEIDDFESRWNEYLQEIMNEQGSEDLDQTDVVLRTLTGEEKNKILKLIPQGELVKLVETVRIG
jgi:hypothetical protein